MEELIISISGAAFAGAIYGIASYFKNKKQAEYLKNFSNVKFLTSVCGSAIIGGIAAYSGVAPDVVTASAVGPLVFQFLNKAFKAVFSE